MSVFNNWALNAKQKPVGALITAVVIGAVGVGIFRATGTLPGESSLALGTKVALSGFVGAAVPGLLVFGYASTIFPS